MINIVTYKVAVLNTVADDEAYDEYVDAADEFNIATDDVVVIVENEDGQYDDYIFETELGDVVAIAKYFAIDGRSIDIYDVDVYAYKGELYVLAETIDNFF